MQDEVRARQPLRVRISHVPVLAREPERLDVREYLGEGAAELAASTRYDDLAEAPLAVPPIRTCGLRPRVRLQ
jgi:hypothetical protein